MNQRLLALRLTGLGWYVASCIVIGVVGGVSLDKWLGIKPLFTLSGILFGVTAAFYGLYKMIQPLIALDQTEPTDKSDDKSRSNGGDP
jgi:F0F1-type ATP synthase assembly protein I